ncbi:MAG: RNA polymerase sigma factor, partial [Verrucomicrobia bacterium]|nr:RNA polymerase sigma factor [Verrucomicrobiota bacterium]
MTPSSKASGAGAGAFLTTHWSVVLRAGRSDSTRARDALAQLCEAYWYPLYAYVRRRGHSPHDAQDLTQEFFARILERHDIARASPERGRFRSFLLASLNHFLANEWDKARAKKRGGGQTLLRLDDKDAEGRYAIEPADDAAPDKLFERRWALTLLERVLARLREEFVTAGKTKLFERLKGFMTSEGGDTNYAQAGAELGMTEGNVKVAVH